MHHFVLETKLYKPELSENIVRRSHITVQLEKEPFGKLVLVSSMAGSGKTTLINGWLTETKLPNLWYSLDDWDNDLQQFFTYLAYGLRKIDDGISQGLLELIDAYQSVGPEAFLKAMISQLHQIKIQYVIVLDDYHLIQNQEIHDVIQTLLKHMPRLLQLIIITREDPVLSLSKLRLKNQLIEIRISDLRFQVQEVQALFQRMSVEVSEKHMELLMNKTEGWIAGLQLAGLSLKNHEDIEGFINRFSVNCHFVMTYFLEEVLQKQREEVKEFLIRTAFLDSFCEELCDAVLSLEIGQSGQIIEYLKKSNIFIISLDQEGKWYRYHHLFRELLQQISQSANRNHEQETCNLTAKWYQVKRVEKEAIHYFVKGENYEGAADVLETLWATMDIQLQSSLWLSLLKMIPGELVQKRPVLSMGAGWALLDAGDVVNSSRYLEQAEKLYASYYDNQGNKLEIIICDWEQFQLLPATIATAYGYRAAITGDIENLFRLANEALKHTPTGLRHKKGLISMLLGVAHWSMGELSLAEEVIKQSLRDIEGEANGLTVNAIISVLGELYIQQGRLTEARKIYVKTISIVKSEDKLPLILASLYLGLAKIAFYQGDRKQSFEWLEKSKECGFAYSIIDWKYKYYLHLAMLYESDGLLEPAMEAISEGNDTYMMNPIPDYISLKALEIKIGLKHNNKRIVESWLDNFEQTKTDEVHYLQEYEFFIYARYRLSKDSSQDLRMLLETTGKLSGYAKRQRRFKNYMECLILESQIHNKLGDIKASMASMKEALRYLIQEEFVQPFMEVVTLMPEVFEKLSKDSEVEGLLQKILHRCNIESDFSTQKANQELIEPLTVREFEVLQLIIAGASNQDICNTLFLALGTVKGYNHIIFKKLGTRSRTQVIVRARELGLTQ